MDELTQQSKVAGLELNPQETKLMTNSTEDTIKVNNTELQYVNEYIYLGQPSPADASSQPLDTLTDRTPPSPEFSKYASLIGQNGNF